MSIAVSIVEDDPGVRASLARLIDKSPGFSCLSQHPSAENAIQELPRANPAVVLMDINLPGLSGVECVRRLKPALPGTQIIMLTVYQNTEHIFNALAAGATGYLLKRTPRDKLLDAIREVHCGGAPMSRQIARRVVQFFQQIDRLPEDARPAPEVSSLTEREHEVLAQLAKGYAYKEIADQLNISFETVRTYVRTIYEKLHVHSRTEATLKYLGR